MGTSPLAVCSLSHRKDGRDFFSNVVSSNSFALISFEFSCIVSLLLGGFCGKHVMSDFPHKIVGQNELTKPDLEGIFGEQGAIILGLRDYDVERHESPTGEVTIGPKKKEYRQPLVEPDPGLFDEFICSTFVNENDVPKPPKFDPLALRIGKVIQKQFGIRKDKAIRLAAANLLGRAPIQKKSKWERDTGRTKPSKSLAWLARALKKDKRTIRRYCERGLIPGAYRTTGNHWRVKQTNKRKVLIQVRQAISSFSRKRKTLSEERKAQRLENLNDRIWKAHVANLLAGRYALKGNFESLPEASQRQIKSGVEKETNQILLNVAALRISDRGEAATQEELANELGITKYRLLRIFPRRSLKRAKEFIARLETQGQPFELPDRKRNGKRWQSEPTPEEYSDNETSDGENLDELED